MGERGYQPKPFKNLGFRVTRHNSSVGLHFERLPKVKLHRVKYPRVKPLSKITLGPMVYYTGIDYPWSNT